MEVRRTEWEPWWELVMKEIFIGGSDQTEPYEEINRQEQTFKLSKVFWTCEFELIFNIIGTFCHSFLQ